MKRLIIIGLLFYVASLNVFADGIIAEIKENVGENWEDISE
jgi:hypothetical protein